MPSRIKYLSVTFREDVMIGAMLLATGTTVSLPDDVARGLGNSVQINGLGSASSAVTPGGSIAIARSTAQLASAPTSADIALGAGGQFYDPLQTVDATHPWVYYSATSTAYVRISSGSTSTLAGATDIATANLPALNAPTATALGLKTSAQGIWNLTTNVATAPDGVTTFTPASGVYPASSANFLLCTGTGTQTIDAQTAHPGDYATMNPALGKWVILSGTTGTITTTAGMLKSGLDGSATHASPNIDYGPPSAATIGVPIVVMPAGTVGANGALSITGTALVSGLVGIYFWGLFPANCLNGSNAAGQYLVKLTSTTAGTIYTNTRASTDSAAIPATPTAFSGTTGSTYTNPIATYDTLISVALGANPMGPNGFLRQRFILLSNASSSSHLTQSRLNSTLCGVQASVSGAAVHLGIIQTIQNQGVTGNQVCSYPQGGDVYAGTGAPAFSAIDTSGSVTYSLATQIGATSDWTAIVSFDLSVNYGA